MVEIREGGCTIVVDSQYWPVVFATWVGEPNESAVTRYFEASEPLWARARKERTRFVLVTDAARTGRPNAKVRKLIADKTNAQTPDTQDLAAGSIIVVENALIRGVVTALGWILPRLKDSTIVGGIEEAVTTALRLLDEQGLARPPGLTAQRYRRPALTATG